MATKPRGKKRIVRKKPASKSVGSRRIIVKRRQMKTKDDVRTKPAPAPAETKVVKTKSNWGLFWIVLAILVLVAAVYVCANQVGNSLRSYIPLNTAEPPAAPAANTQVPAPVANTEVPAAANTQVPAVPPAAVNTQVPAVPPAAPAANQPADGSAGTFNYVPGGPNYAWPETGVTQMGDGWTRIVQNANGQYNAWTFLVRVACDREIGDRLQWDSSTRLNVYGPISCKIEIRRDLESSKSINPDPYNVANAKNSPLGLGWFIYGQGDATVNGSAMTLNGPGVKQMGFPHDWTGTWVITTKVPANGLIVLLQGEKITTPDTWPLP